MAFLMQMMQQQNPKPGMQGGMTPGMNFNGGNTDMAATAQNGNATGKADAARIGSQSRRLAARVCRLSSAMRFGELLQSDREGPAVTISQFGRASLEFGLSPAKARNRRRAYKFCSVSRSSRALPPKGGTTYLGSSAGGDGRLFIAWAGTFSG
jgi:hypothetical protein